MIKPGIYIILTAIFFTSYAHAETLTVEQAVNEAVDQSPIARRSHAALDESRWRGREAFTAFLPKLSVTGSHFFETKYQLLTANLGPSPVLFPLVYPSTLLEADATINLFDGFQSTNRYQAGSLSADAAEKDDSWAAFQLDHQVRLGFARAIAAQKLSSVAEQNIRTLTDHLNKAQMLQRGGAATQFDVLRIEVQLNEAQSDKIAADDNVAIEREHLAEIMGIENDSRQLAGDLAAPDVKVLSNEGDSKKPDLSQRLDIQSRDMMAAAASKRHSGENLYWLPKLNLGAQYQVYNNVNRSFSDSENFRSAYNLGIFLTWNIFDGGASYTRARQAGAQAVQAEAAADQARLQAPHEVDRWRRRYLLNAARFKAKVSDVEKAQEAVRLANLGFRAGARTNTDVLDAELDLFRARAGVIQTQLDASEALINYELATGRKLQK